MVWVRPPLLQAMWEWHWRLPLRCQPTVLQPACGECWPSGVQVAVLCLEWLREDRHCVSLGPIDSSGVCCKCLQICGHVHKCAQFHGVVASPASAGVWQQGHHRASKGEQEAPCGRTALRLGSVVQLYLSIIICLWAACTVVLFCTDVQLYSCRPLGLFSGFVVGPMLVQLYSCRPDCLGIVV